MGNRPRPPVSSRRAHLALMANASKAACNPATDVEPAASSSATIGAASPIASIVPSTALLAAEVQSIAEEESLEKHDAPPLAEVSCSCTAEGLQAPRAPCEEGGDDDYTKQAVIQPSMASGGFPQMSDKAFSSTASAFDERPEAESMVWAAGEEEEREPMLETAEQAEETLLLESPEAAESVVAHSRPNTAPENLQAEELAETPGPSRPFTAPEHMESVAVSAKAAAAALEVAIIDDTRKAEDAAKDAVHAALAERPQPVEASERPRPTSGEVREAKAQAVHEVARACSEVLERISPKAADAVTSDAAQATYLTVGLLPEPVTASKDYHAGVDDAATAAADQLAYPTVGVLPESLTDSKDGDGDAEWPAAADAPLGNSDLVNCASLQAVASSSLAPVGSDVQASNAEVGDQSYTTAFEDGEMLSMSFSGAAEPKHEGPGISGSCSSLRCEDNLVEHPPAVATAGEPRPWPGAVAHSTQSLDEGMESEPQDFSVAYESRDFEDETTVTVENSPPDAKLAQSALDQDDAEKRCDEDDGEYDDCCMFEDDDESEEETVADLKAISQEENLGPPMTAATVSSQASTVSAAPKARPLKTSGASKGIEAESAGSEYEDNLFEDDDSGPESD